MQLRTAAGHGLRQTLFYSLFGELQVYETRKCMHQACVVIKHGAISLDGGIMRENGFLSLGCGYVLCDLYPCINIISPCLFGSKKVAFLSFYHLAFKNSFELLDSHSVCVVMDFYV